MYEKHNVKKHTAIEKRKRIYAEKIGGFDAGQRTGNIQMGNRPVLSRYRITAPADRCTGNEYRYALSGSFDIDTMEESETFEI